MRWSTCGWTLLSHNSPICVIASCVVPYQSKGLCEIHYDQICLLVSTIHSAIQVADDIVHKLDQLGFAGPLRKPCWQSASMLSKAKCLLMLLTNILKELRNATNTSSHCKHTIWCNFLLKMIFIHRSAMCPSNYCRFNVIIDYVIIFVCA